MYAVWESFQLTWVPATPIVFFFQSFWELSVKAVASVPSHSCYPDTAALEACSAGWNSAREGEVLIALSLVLPDFSDASGH